MQKIKKIVYSIYPRLYCSGTIYVNDVPVIEWFGDQTKQGGYGGDTIINHVLLQSGKYKVVGKMLPRFGASSLTEEEAMEIQFFSADQDNWKQSRTQFHPKIASPWDGLSENINYPAFEIATEIEVELPFVLDGWQKSVDLSKLDAKKLFQEVLNYYRQIHAVLKSHNAAKFLDLSQEKMQLQEQAFYFNEERKKSFTQGLLELFGQSLEVEPLVESELTLQVMGYGKLVRLIKKDGSQPLQFKSPNSEEQSNVELEVKLHKRTVDKGLSII